MKIKRGIKESVLGLTGAIILVFTNTGKSSIYHNPQHYRTRWSMQKHGLISGGWKWSMHAHDIVPRNVRYSPYAHNYKHPSGLVWDNKDNYGLFLSNREDVLYKKDSQNQSTYPSAIFIIYDFQTPDNPAIPAGPIKTPEERRQETTSRRINIEKELARRRKLKENDSASVIYNFLRDKNKKFTIYGGLNVSGKTLGNHFILQDTKTIIKYTNSEEMENLKSHQTAHKKRFEETSKSFCETRKQAGWKIYEINSGNKQKIKENLETLLD